jgi:prolyl-tRNA synthetase
VKIDDDNQKTPGWKFNERELKGVPVRIAIGKRDLDQGQVEIFRRDTMEKQFVKLENLTNEIKKILKEIQENLYIKHMNFTKEHTYTADTYEELKEKVEKGFVLAHWD